MREREAWIVDRMSLGSPLTGDTKKGQKKKSRFPKGKEEKKRIKRKEHIPTGEIIMREGDLREERITTS